MRNVYKDMIVDIGDSKCEFIEEFNKEIKKNGAIVYNFESNSYQFIRKFEHIDVKKEVLPDFIKIEDTNPLLKGLNITVHYEFDPETEEDKENLEIWENDISTIDLPYYNYDEDGEYYVEKTFKMNTKTSQHTVWFLKDGSFDYIADKDLLMFTPIIKNINIARDLIKSYAVHPFENTYNQKDSEYQEPDMSIVYNPKSE